MKKLLVVMFSATLFLAGCGDKDESGSLTETVTEAAEEATEAAEEAAEAVEEAAEDAAEAAEDAAEDVKEAAEEAGELDTDHAATDYDERFRHIPPTCKRNQNKERRLMWSFWYPRQSRQ